MYFHKMTTRMDDSNEMAEFHSAGATVRHISPFDDLPTHRNTTTLPAGFIKKWVLPLYMEIGSNGDTGWMKSISEIKQDITPDICLLLLGDFNWRTRLVGAYFSAVKDYRDHIALIGVHLLKSEVCCVGHIYALVLACFNTDKSIGYLHQYLNYYLTTPNLYFDQTSVMEALLYLDKINQTNEFEKYHNHWKTLVDRRAPLENQAAWNIVKLLAAQGDQDAADSFMQSISAQKPQETTIFTTDYFDKQIAILSDLRRLSC